MAAPAPRSDRPGTAGEIRASRRRLWVGAAIGAVIIVAAGLGAAWHLQGNSTRQASARPAASFVGSEACAECHTSETALWRASQHKHAMDHATEKTVLGDFGNATFDHYGMQSRFFRKDGRFMVETDGPDGKPGVFEIKYTFGLDPLQQYLVEFPDGRLQVLSVAWDSRPKQQGGQRWFHLYPDEPIRHDDVLHWTKLSQNWNFMCAECHSTGVRKSYDATNDRFATTWAEISVGCEACHGRGSRHVGWARDRQSWWPFGKDEDPAKGLVVRFDERCDVTWPINVRTGNAQRSVPPALLRKEVETCGLCHARRGVFSEDWVPGRWLSDTHAVSPITQGLYHADGQMLDEVYNYGSFKQSKMFAAGVTCSDCHDPHSAKLRFPGDNTCLQCHSSDKYSDAAHNGHATTSPPLACVSCHMPARTYMVVDPRHDHGFRVPRPDLSAKLGTPNACNDCHTDKSAVWAADAVERRHGSDRKGFQSFAEALKAAWTGKGNSAALLTSVARNSGAPGIARASALAALASGVSPSTIDLARAGLKDADPMVRIGAMDMLENVPAAQAWPLVSPLLSDPVRGVRIRAAALLAAVPSATQPPADRDHFERAAAELVAAQQINADRPEARTTLGNYLAHRGRFGEAEAEYKAALRLSPQYGPAATNLADLYRGLKRDDDSESVLRAAIAASPGDAGLHHALGLALIRLDRRKDALDELRKATELAPDQPRYAYVYAVGLHSAGRVAEAMAILEESLKKRPEDRDMLRAVVSFSRNAGDAAVALDHAERLLRITPDDRELAILIENLRRAANPGGSKSMHSP
ncbi:tetratricopeptide repeat protein [Rhodoplanes sp.]|uniref:multiheme c-type cytochrome n=1 Tax=Rhodoplanes sp. TaxID=1968906 RepID=UPI0025EF4DFB|nr:tetratricopeptide repeat protein [Rhodoplanes sp.]